MCFGQCRIYMNALHACGCGHYDNRRSPKFVFLIVTYALVQHSPVGPDRISISPGRRNYITWCHGFANDMLLILVSADDVQLIFCRLNQCTPILDGLAQSIAVVNPDCYSTRQYNCMR